jgi:biopolymer transport protein ExbD
MNFKSKRLEEVEINMVPMVDVVLMLMIFFMLTTTFNREAEIQIELPEASGKPLPKDEFVLDISIDNQGRYFVNQKRVRDGKVETLVSAIKLTMGANTKVHVLINSDKNTPYQSVVSAMDAVRQLGLKKFSLTIKQPSEDK